jgi:histidine triad (HIT) family protein
MENNCIFCKIVAGQTGTELVYQDEQVTVFHDREPAAPVHLLIVPNRHVTSLNEISATDRDWLVQVMLVAGQIARQMNVHESGFRLLTNTGADAGQSVYHLHFHLLGGTQLNRLGWRGGGWPGN